MQKFNKLKSIPAYLPIVNIDTDMIIPKQFLKTIKRTGLGKNLFFEMRYDDKGSVIKEFILNQDPFTKSKILIAGKNFGCGSSREHAPWALLDFGITCVISSSYADIFYNNCFKNGILPIKIDEEKIKQISEYFQGTRTQFELPLQMNGTDFQVRIWKLLSLIPFGSTMAYVKVAKKFGDSKMIRAVVSAIIKNPLSIVIPCHRIIGSDGSMVGYSCGIKTKRLLLEYEGYPK